MTSPHQQQQQQQQAHQLLLRWSIVLVVLAGWRTTVAIARPAEFGAEPEDESAEMPSAGAGASVVAVPVRVFTDPDSAFGRVLHRRLAAMSDRDLSVLESGLRMAVTNSAATAAAVDEEMMMGDMPSVDATDNLPPQETQSPSPDNLQPTAPSDDIVLADRER